MVKGLHPYATRHHSIRSHLRDVVPDVVELGAAAAATAETAIGRRRSRGIGGGGASGGRRGRDRVDDARAELRGEERVEPLLDLL